MQSDMPLGIDSNSKKGTVIRSIQADELSAHYQSKNFAPRCRDILHSQSIERFSDLYSSLKVFGNISENKITFINTVLLNFQF